MNKIDRRHLLTGGATLAGMTAMGTAVKADVPAGLDPFEYEVTRTDEEWRELLGDDFGILREGKTEPQYTSPLWAEAREGVYNCKGCDLPHYASQLKVNLLKGWLFFTASEPNSQLMSQDAGAIMSGSSITREDISEIDDPFKINIEVHCRRCGSHTGHILLVEGSALHCINGGSLNFVSKYT